MTAAIAGSARTNILPAIRYRNVESAARWLCSAFGFEVQSVVRNPAGEINYVHLTYGPAKVLLRAMLDSSFDRLMKQPDEIGGAETQSCYLIVEDASEHHRAALAAGAEIVIELQDFPGSGQGYSCRDPEGHIWSFGTFDPWHGSSPMLEPALQALPARRKTANRRHVALAALAGGIVGSIAVGLFILKHPQPGQLTIEKQIHAEQIMRERSELAARQAAEALVGERTAKEGFQRAAKLMETELASVTAGKTEAEQQVKTTTDQLASETSALQQAHAAGEALEARLAESIAAREASEQRVAEEIEKARAAAEKAQADRAASEATAAQRVFTIETNFHQEQTLREAAVAAQSKAEAELSKAVAELGEAKKARKEAETALANTVEKLEHERDERLSAERDADVLRKRLAGDRPARNKAVAKARSGPVRLKKQASSAVVKKPVSQDPWDLPPLPANKAGSSGSYQGASVKKTDSVQDFWITQ